MDPDVLYRLILEHHDELDRQLLAARARQTDEPGLAATALSWLRDRF